MWAHWEHLITPSYQLLVFLQVRVSVSTQVMGERTILAEEN